MLRSPVPSELGVNNLKDLRHMSIDVRNEVKDSELELNVTSSKIQIDDQGDSDSASNNIRNRTTKRGSFSNQQRNNSMQSSYMGTGNKGFKVGQMKYAKSKFGGKRVSQAPVSHYDLINADLPELNQGENEEPPFQATGF